MIVFSSEKNERRMLRLTASLAAKSPPASARHSTAPASATSIS